jgi:DNA-binding CsgD family transcriptional regulator
LTTTVQARAVPTGAIFVGRTKGSRQRGEAERVFVAILRKANGDLVVVTDRGLTIGRDPVNDVILNQDKLVSRSHAEILLRDRQWYLIDLGSRNGTVVNVRAAQRHPLRDGDVIGIGSTTFEFVSESDPHVTEAPAIVSRPESPASLTEREHDVLRLISQGFTDKVIAERLFISVNTVRSHLERIREKTGLRRRSELTRFAITLELGDEKEFLAEGGRGGP